MYIYQFARCQMCINTSDGAKIYESLVINILNLQPYFVTVPHNHYLWPLLPLTLYKAVDIPHNIRACLAEGSDKVTEYPLCRLLVTGWAGCFKEPFKEGGRLFLHFKSPCGQDYVILSP